MPAVEKHLRVSKKIETDDLDWDLAAEIGLTEEERTILTYFGDIEGQTVYYLREVLNTKPARNPELLAFLTIWNYEEFYHSRAIATLLDVCGESGSMERQSDVRASAQFAAKFEEVVQTMISKLLPKTFLSLWMAWGASQELLTLRGYEQLSRQTKNPVLAELCRRIAKQERRHFAYYFNGAAERLEGHRFQQRFVRFLFEKFWTPVGGGVKSEKQIAEMVAGLFPGDELETVMANFDAKLGALPGMHGFAVGRAYAAKIRPHAAQLPAGSELLLSA